MSDRRARPDRDRRTHRSDPTDDPLDHPADPGAYLGRKPEREAETIPGGVRPGDERIAAHASERAPIHDDSDLGPDRREAGQDR